MQDRLAQFEKENALAQQEEKTQMRDDHFEYLEEMKRQKKIRRISGMAWVEEGGAEVAMAEIRKTLGGLGIDCKYSHSKRHHDLEGRSKGVKTWAYIDIWCDATPDAVNELARHGFMGLVYCMIKNAGAIGGVNDEAEFDIPDVV